MVMMGCRKGPWTAEEDKLLTEYVKSHGEGRWTSVANSSGLNRNGKSCRLRWVNYLRPGLKRSQLTTQEESIIIELHALWGNKWSTISKYLPGRTDNEIKNYWRTYLRHKEKYPEIDQEKQKNQVLTSQRRQLQVPADLGRILTQPEIDHGMVCKGQGKDQENVFIYPNLELEDQCSSVMFQDGVPPRSDTMGEEGTLWGSLWNLDDAPVHHTFNNNKIII